MGCISSKPAKSGSRDNGTREEERVENRSGNLRNSKRRSSDLNGGQAGRLSISNRFVEAEQVAAGWPSWLSSAAPEAIHGWVPLSADSFEKLEKIGQGTYSNVFRARELQTGRMVALKKVRFDNLQPESIKFMAREIMILRRLDHPNIIKLEGIITSRLSCSIYFVFEYMEHDLAGLVSCPDVKFSDAQVKCYMKQLLSGVEHCHLQGIMHRDIKTSNILVNNEGILKLGDFGLANVLDSRGQQILTSRVVTLWYRPPELLMGSTNYGVSIDLWSVGCAFAELLFGKPILRGRTEVEQLHKIFKLCGSPPEEFWKKSKLPHATMFKPHHPYPSTLREKCKDFPPCVENMIETFLSVEPYKRGTASSALMSSYFRTKPYACDASSLPKYPPIKEIDVKSRDEARRNKAGVRMREVGAARRPKRVHKSFQATNGFHNIVTQEDNAQFSHINGVQVNGPTGRAAYGKPSRPPQDVVSDVSQLTDTAQGDIGVPGLIHVSGPTGFAWAKRQKEGASLARSKSKSSSRRHLSAVDPASLLFEKSLPSATEKRNEDDRNKICVNYGDADEHGASKNEIGNQQNQFDWSLSFDVSNRYHSQDLSAQLRLKGSPIYPINNMDHGGCIEFSGPLLTQLSDFDQFLQQNESNIREAVRRSRFKRGK